MVLGCELYIGLTGIHFEPDELYSMFTGPLITFQTYTYAPLLHEYFTYWITNVDRNGTKQKGFQVMSFF